MRSYPKNILSTLVLLLSATSFTLAQEGPKSTTLSELKNSTPVMPSAADVMRTRISKAKAYLVVKNYPAAIYELENIRRETNDQTVHRVLNVLLMHAYLEQGEYVKAQKFLKELDADKSKSDDYFAVAGQVISGARTQLARYQALGIPVTDRSLPEAAASDLDGMRETLELVATQSRAKAKQKGLSATAAAVFEESSAARGNLGRDAYDERLWKDQVAEAREQIVNPRTRIIDVASSPVLPQQVTLVATTAGQDEEQKATEKVDSDKLTGTASKPRLEPKALEKDFEAAKVAAEPKTDESEVANAQTTGDAVNPSDRKVRIITSAEKNPDGKKKESIEQPNVKSTDQVAMSPSAKKSKEVDPAKQPAATSSPIPIGSLISYATRRVTPVYPQQARSMLMEGTVKVEVLVGEDGKVSKVEKASGPALLKRAAREAIEKWEFKPFLLDGLPVKATGYVSFNFNL